MSTPTSKDTLVVTRPNPTTTILSVPLTAFNRLKIGTRCTLLRLTSGTHIVISPIAITPHVSQILDFVSSQGWSIGYLIAPNFEHYLYLQQWHERFPDAIVIAPLGLREKRFSAGNVRFDHELDTDRQMAISREFDGEVDMKLITATFNKEILVNHRVSGTLVEGDIWFNLPATQQYENSDEDPQDNLPTRIVTALHSVKGGTLTRRMMWYGFTLGKTKLLGEQMREVMGWEWDTVVPCHGGVVESGGKQLLKSFLQGII